MAETVVLQVIGVTGIVVFSVIGVAEVVFYVIGVAETVVL